FLASNTCLACSAGISGARRATFPSLTAMSRQSTDVLLGRTTRAFLITRSNGFSIPGFFPCWRCRPAVTKFGCFSAERLGVANEADDQSFRRHRRVPFLLPEGRAGDWYRLPSASICGVPISSLMLVKSSMRERNGLEVPLAASEA